MTRSRGFRQAESIGQVRALVRTRSTYDELLTEAVKSACELGVPRAVLAEVLGVHRATFYRQFGPVIVPGVSPTQSGIPGRSGSEVV